MPPVCDIVLPRTAAATLRSGPAWLDRLARQRWFWAAARFAAVVFFLVTSADCLLAYLPFTYYEVQLGGLLPSLNWFVRFHPYCYWAVLLLLAVSMKGDLACRELRRQVSALLVLLGTAGLLLMVHPLLSSLQNNAGSLVWSLVFLLPLAGIGAIDFLAGRTAVRWGDVVVNEQERIFATLCSSALYVAGVYALVFALRYLRPAQAGFTLGQWLIAAAWSALSHLMLFVSVFLVFSLLTGIAGLFSRAAKAEFFLETAALALAMMAIIRYVIFSAISFSGPAAWLVAGLTALAVVVSGAGLALRLHRPADGPACSGLSVLLRPLRFIESLKPPYSYLPLLAIFLLAYFLAARTAIFDWGYLFQELGVLLVWFLGFAVIFLTARPLRWKPPLAGLFGGTMMVLVVYVAGLGLAPRWERWFQNSQSGSSLLEEYADYDVSFRLAYHTLAPAHSSLFSSGSDSFYSFLAQNTHIPRSVPVSPVDVNLVASLQPTTVARPNIFVFVIDSLRRDYLSPYNSRVGFTPAIAAFAADSVILQNVFTQYGGTGLSEPAIWTGSLLLHKQYITPFYPMNALQKLLNTDGYRLFVAEDEILRSIVQPSSSLVQLAEDATPAKQEFCRTLSDLQGRLADRSDSRPVFAYAQPQNIHISVINHEGRSTPRGESYPGFDAPYASRLHRVDACFGGFIQFLRSAGLYDNSVVILTSDHGDSLGEGGRWGHAYTLFPEIVRVPLIFHLPPSLRTGLYVDPARLAFLTDITPTLYYLLGHRNVEHNPLFGRPLFTRTPEEQDAYLRDSYLVVSSYAPVYGVVSNNGRTLFVADGVNYTDEYFDLSANVPTFMPITATVRAEKQALIRDYVLDISRFYHFHGVH